MARKTEMRLMELIVLKEDVSRVVEFLGRKEKVEFQFHKDEAVGGGVSYKELFDKLQSVRMYLEMDDLSCYRDDSAFPCDNDVEQAKNIISIVEDLRKQEQELRAAGKGSSFSEKISSRLGLEKGGRGIAGSDESADSKTEVLAEAVEVLRQQEQDLRAARLAEIDKQMADERRRIVDVYGEEIRRLLGILSMGSNVQQMESCLESTKYAYKICGWVSQDDAKELADELYSLTNQKLAICLYRPDEISDVTNGREKVPVRFKHNKLVTSFERMLFSYGAPQYGTIDATPLMAFFFPLLFGIMFGDAGQGLVFLLIGILLSTGIIKKFPTWNKFGPIFIAIGCTSTIMGVLTGEFFANNTVLVPLSRAITGLFGEPHDHILHLMPSADTIGTVFMFFGFTLVIGFIMNSIGLIINMINQFSLGKPYKAIFGKTGLCGAVFFWYVVFMAIRIAFLGIPLFVGDWIVIGVSLLGACFGHPIERMLRKEKPVFEHGVGVGIIEGVVEILEIVSSYLSNTVSFLRVGAFGLAHAVLGFIIHTMSEMVGGVGGVAVMVVGNAIVIVLEGMIVAIQVVRLHYYEFFSKFFAETGREFKPFRFQYNVEA